MIASVRVLARVGLAIGLLAPAAMHGDATCAVERCSCISERISGATMQERMAGRLAESDAVVLATVHRIDTVGRRLPPSQWGPTTVPTRPVVARLRVERAWSAGARDTLTIRFHDARQDGVGMFSSCDLILQRDSSYLIFARRVGRAGTLSAGKCSGTRTRAVAEADGSLAALGPGRVPAPR